MITVKIIDILRSMVLVTEHINQISLDAKDNTITELDRYAENKIVELEEAATKKKLDTEFTIDLFGFVCEYIVDKFSNQESDT